MDINGASEKIVTKEPKCNECRVSEVKGAGQRRKGPVSTAVGDYGDYSEEDESVKLLRSIQSWASISTTATVAR